MALSIKNMCDGIKKDAIAHIRRFDEKQEEDKEVSTFPISCFPSDIQKIVLALRDFLGFPIDYTSAAVLVAFSSGIGNQVRIKVKNGWIESAALYCALVGKPGSNKSHPMSFILQPFILHDQRTYEVYISALDEYEALKEMTKKERLAKGIEEMPQMPHWKQMVVSDVTQESLGKVLSHNPHGVCLYSDELASWLKNFERYNKGSEEQFWLSLFNNKLVTTSRKMDKRPINIAHPSASVIGSIQLDILQMLMKGDKGKNGFFDRILFAYFDGETDRDVVSIVRRFEQALHVDDIVQKKPSYIAEDIMLRSKRGYDNNHFVRFLNSLFPEPTVLNVLKRYHVGTANLWEGAVVFWQVDVDGKVHDGKIMLYDVATSHRADRVSWAHSAMKMKDFVLEQCFFGEYLLVDKHKPIAIVESEKTAIIASLFMDDFIWLASGGKDGCFNRRKHVLKGRKWSCFQT